VAEAVRNEYGPEQGAGVLAFRNCVEVNGDGYVLRRITTFRECSLSIICIPNNVESLGNLCFCECFGLHEIVFESDSRLKEIGNSAFSSLGIESIEIPSNVEYIGDKCVS
jgi:hypothetical protein